jgi:hypothetical protein
MHIFMAFLFWSTFLMFASAVHGGFGRGSTLGAYGCLGKTSEVVTNATIEGVSELMQLKNPLGSSSHGSYEWVGHFRHHRSA